LGQEDSLEQAPEGFRFDTQQTQPEEELFVRRFNEFKSNIEHFRGTETFSERVLFAVYMFKDIVEADLEGIVNEPNKASLQNILRGQITELESIISVDINKLPSRETVEDYQISIDNLTVRFRRAVQLSENAPNTSIKVMQEILTHIQSLYDEIQLTRLLDENLYSDLAPLITNLNMLYDLVTYTLEEVRKGPPVQQDDTIRIKAAIDLVRNIDRAMLATTPHKDESMLSRRSFIKYSAVGLALTGAYLTLNKLDLLVDPDILAQEEYLKRRFALLTEYARQLRQQEKYVYTAVFALQIVKDSTEAALEIIKRGEVNLRIQRLIQKQIAELSELINTDSANLPRRETPKDFTSSLIGLAMRFKEAARFSSYAPDTGVRVMQNIVDHIDFLIDEIDIMRSFSTEDLFDFDEDLQYDMLTQQIVIFKMIIYEAIETIESPPSGIPIKGTPWQMALHLLKRTPLSDAAMTAKEKLKFLQLWLGPNRDFIKISDHAMTATLDTRPESATETYMARRFGDITLKTLRRLDTLLATNNAEEFNNRRTELITPEDLLDYLTPILGDAFDRLTVSVTSDDENLPELNPLKELDNLVIYLQSKTSFEIKGIYKRNHRSYIMDDLSEYTVSSLPITDTIAEVIMQDTNNNRWVGIVEDAEIFMQMLNLIYDIAPTI